MLPFGSLICINWLLNGTQAEKRDKESQIEQYDPEGNIAEETGNNIIRKDKIAK